MVMIAVWLDRGEVDQPAAMEHLALRQLVLDENLIDGLQIVFRREVHHCQILVVELLVLLDRVAVAAHKMEEEILVRVHMPVEVHHHEPGQLQESGIDQPPVPADSAREPR